MITQGLGEVLTNALTVNPALAELPSASAILDTSNYTFQAVTFGKDAQGFQGFHAHAVLYPSSTNYVDDDPTLTASSYDLGTLLLDNSLVVRDVEGGGGISTSSYVTSAVYDYYSETYNSVPNYPMPSDTRLERGSTKNTAISEFTNYSAIPDLGHYLNPVIDPTVSAAFNKIGGYPPSGPTSLDSPLSTSGGFSFVINSTSSFAGTCDSYFNANELMDSHGYLTVSPFSASASVDFSKGANVTSSVDAVPLKGRVALDSVIKYGDAAWLAAFGGVKHVGVYCLDMKEMLASGLLPPYDRATLNNTRKYLLVAKATSVFDILFHRDWSTSSGFQHGLNGGAGATQGGPRISIIFDFN